MIIANVHKAKTDLSKLIAAAMAGEEVVISKNNEPVVDLVKHQKKLERKPGLFKGRVFLMDEEHFDDEDTEINKLFGVE
jgi:prevent-host-death family protein